jgi:uncharacterized repeat protein (TIGR03803 family)
MKTKLNLSAVIIFALAAALRVEAGGSYIGGEPEFVNIRNNGGTGDVSQPGGNLIQAANGNIYGVAQTGYDEFYNGGVFVLSPGGVLDAFNGDGNYATLFSMPGGIGGAFPTCLAGSGNTLFLATSGGGTDGVGVLFTLDVGTGVNATTSFAAINGADVNAKGIAVVPTAVANSNSVFVACETAGASGDGAVFKYYTFYNGPGLHYTVVEAPAFHFFDNDDGKYCFDVSSDHVFLPSSKVRANGVKANDDESAITLYGVTLSGGTNANGSSGFGTVFKVNDDSSGFQTLHVFSTQSGTNGYEPAGGVVLSGNTLYGTTSGGGKYGSGTVFKMDTSGSNFMVLKSFSAYGFGSGINLTNSDGEAPEGDLILSGNTLYGTTLAGGTNGGGGVVYSINTNGGNFTLLHSFSALVDNGTGTYTNSDGGGTRSGLLLSGNILYGTTPMGGPYGGGTVFAIVLPTPPALNIAPTGGGVKIFWPSSATNFMLQKNLTLNSQTWSNFNGTVNDDSTNKSISVMPAAGNAFFRLLNTNGP